MVSVDEYIAKQPRDVQPILERVRQIVLKASPKIIETIKYGMPSYVLKKNIFHFSANKNHLGIYPTPEPIEVFKNILSPYKTSKGAIQFSYTENIPYDIIEKLINYQVEKYEV